jgi:phenylalanyl-tRNA synthetase alpha chain
VDWESYRADGVRAFAGAADSEELAAVHVRYLGRRAPLPLALREVREREAGRLLNSIRASLEEAEQEAETRLAAARPTLVGDVDVTLPGSAPPRGHLHPITQIRREVEDIFVGLGFEVVDGREVETGRYNFDGLNMPPWHPARSPQASLFFTEDMLLRTETSPSQIRTMEARKPPIAMVSLGRTYRRDTIDATHFPIFHQVEGLVVDRGITLADLKGTLLHLMRSLFGADREVRFRTHYFPFTEPSMEPDVSCFECGGEGCRICKYSGWIEMGGSGMVDPAVFEFVGYDPEEVTGFAFGLGLERIAQLRHAIPDIRLLWQNDLRVLEQF